MAIPVLNGLDLSSTKITNLATPTAATDGATKGYVDSVAQGLDVKASVQRATTAALPAVTYASGAGTLTENANGALSVDGGTPSVGDRILVKDQASTFQNGIYTVTQVGSGAAVFILTRATDADTGAELSPGAFVWVEVGTTNADSGWLITSDVAVPNLTSDAITWTQFSGAGQITAGAALSKTGNTLDVVAGTGITVAGDAVNIDTSVVPRLAAANTFTLPQTIDLAATGIALTLDVHTGGGENWLSLTEGGAARGTLHELTNGVVLDSVNDITVSGGINTNIFAGTTMLLNSTSGAITITSGTGPATIKSNNAGIRLAPISGSYSVDVQPQSGLSSPIINVSDPTNAQDAATKAYVDALTNDYKKSVRAASTANGTLATAFENGDAMDGVTLATGDRILLKNQTTGAENGIYTVNASGAPTRATDADAAGELSGGTAVYVEEGTTQADSLWTITTNGSITPGTTAHVYKRMFGNYAKDVGDGASTTIDVTHNFGTKDVTVGFFANGSPYSEAEPTVQHLDTNTIRLIFDTAPASNAYRVVIAP